MPSTVLGTRKTDMNHIKFLLSEFREFMFQGSRVESNNKIDKLMNKIILHSDELFEKN